jgi:hypothetical protein
MTTYEPGGREEVPPHSQERSARGVEGCGGCAGLGSHARACPVVVGPDAARYHRWADQLNNIGDSVGPNDMAASGHIWAAAASLRRKANAEAAWYQRGANR